MTVREINFWYFIVSLLPKKLIYFCTLHLIAYCTTDEYSSTIVPDLTAMDAVKRYSDDMLK